MSFNSPSSTSHQTKVIVVRTLPPVSVAASMSRSDAVSQQQTRLAAQRARLDELLAGTEWAAHRGKGVQHVLSVIQSKPHQPCIHLRARAETSSGVEPRQVERQSDEFEAPETFEDYGSDTSSDGREASDSDCSSPPSHPSSNSRASPSEQDSSASSRIVYLSAPSSHSGVSHSPPSAASRNRTPSRTLLRTLSPILRTPASTVSTLSSSTSASGASSASSHSSASSRTAPVKRAQRLSRSSQLSYSSHSASTPSTASVESEAPTLSVYWPWSGGHAERGSDCDAVSEQQHEESSSADALEESGAAEEIEPGMSVANSDLPAHSALVGRLSVARPLDSDNTAIKLEDAAVADGVSDAMASAEQEENDEEEAHATSPSITARRTVSRRRVLVSDDDENSDAEPASLQEVEQAESAEESAAHVEEETAHVTSDDDAPVVAPRRARARRRQIVSDDEGEMDDVSNPQRSTQDVRPAPLPQPSPLRDITNLRLSKTPPFAQPFASPPAKFHPPSSFVFATPAARPTRSFLPAASHFTHAVDGGRQTRSAVRDATRNGGTVRGAEEDEMDLYATPMIERIRQHKAALYNRQSEEAEAEEEDEEEDEEAADQDEYDQSFIVDDDEVEEADDDSDDCPSRCPRRPTHRSNPPSSSASQPPPQGRARLPHCPALTKRNRVQLARDVYVAVNRDAFSGRLPADLPIEWCNKLSTTAGHCRLLQGVERRCIVTLATKVIDSYERLRKTLAHEMCHAAAWLLDGCNRPPHGRTFRHYAQLCERSLPGVTISTCHTYAIYYPWRYRCTQPHCAQEVGRHTDSLDVAVSRCGRCGGRLARLGKFARDGTPVAAREVKGFAAFVKAQQARVRAEHPGTPQRAVMGLLSAEWKRQQAANEAAPGRKGEGEEEEQLVQRMLDLDVVEEE